MHRQRWLMFVLALVLSAGLARADGAAAPSPTDPTKPAEAPAPAAPAPAPADTKPGPVPVPAPPPAPAKPAAATDAVVLDASSLEAIIGRSVKSPLGEDMGRVVDMLVTSGGEVRAAVIDFGGFLGVGSRKIAVDWKALNFTDVAKSGNVIVVLTRNQVRMAPEYKQGDPIVVLEATTAEKAAVPPTPPAPAAQADGAKADGMKADGANPPPAAAPAEAPKPAPESTPASNDTQKK